MQDLERRIDDLERKLARKTEALDQAFDETQALIYTITHDFRAPLRAILASVMILREDYGEVLGADGNGELQRQEGNVRRLNDLLEELLKVSRLARHEFAPKRVALGEIAQRAAEEVGPAAREALNVDGEFELDADPVLLQMALRQVIDNSVKFARKDLPLEILVGGSDGRYFVKDNGVGFDRSRADKIFIPFERLHGDEYPGVGIGLTLFKRIVDRHKGRVGFESSPGQGATIWFELDE